MDRRQRVLGVCSALLCGVSLYLARLYRVRRATRVRDATQRHHDALIAHATLPLYVDHDALPGRWQVQVPVYYPPRRAALLLVRPAILSPTTHHGKDSPADSHTSDRRDSTSSGRASYEGSLCSEVSVLVMCEGPLAVPQPCNDVAAFLLHYLTHHTMLQAMLCTEQGTVAAQLVPVTALLPRCSSQVFSHAVLINSTLVLCGLNACYVSLLVWPLDAVAVDSRTGSPTTKAETGSPDKDAVANGDDSKPPTSPLLPQEQQSICEVLRAIHTVPLLCDGDASSHLVPRPPGAPIGVQRGEHHVRCIVAGHMIVLKAPAWLAVRDCRADLSPQSAGERSVQGVLSFVACATGLSTDVPMHSVSSQAEALVLTKSDFSALCALPLPKESRLADCLVTAQAAGAEQPSAPMTNEAAAVARAVTVSQVTECEDNAEEDVMVVYTQPVMRVSFGVDAKRGCVLDCILSSHLQVVYYPFGVDAPHETQSQPYISGDVARITLRYMTRLPPTWERAVGDEAELRHNVLLHFTDWMQGQTPCTVTELSGQRCVQFVESKEGWRCRTYVVPRGNSTVLVILLEAPDEQWARCEPCFDSFVDTLNINDEAQ